MRLAIAATGATLVSDKRFPFDVGGGFGVVRWLRRSSICVNARSPCR
jgi:hypothetical protein